MTVIPRELDGAAECFFQAVREERLAVFGRRRCVPVRSHRTSPGRAHIAVETETRPGYVGIQIEPEEIWLLVTEDLLTGLKG